MHKTLDAKIWAIAWPAIVANVSIPLLGLVDAALLGHLDSANHLAAVAVGAAVLSFMYWGFGFLRMGTTGEVARAVGRKSADLAFLAVARASVVAILLAVLLLLCRNPLVELGLFFMGPSAEIGGLAHRYAELRLSSAPAVLLTYGAVGWFIGHQDTRWPLRIVLTTNLINIALDAIFILGLEMASEGAALATVIAEYCGLLVALWGMRSQLPQIQSTALWQSLAKLQGYVPMLQSNANLFLRTLALLFAFAYFVAQGENLGVTVVAANAILIQALMFSAFSMDGFAYAAESLTGEALGAGDTQRFHAICRRCGLWVGATGVLISLVLALVHTSVFPLLSGLPEVVSAMLEQRLWLIVMPLLAAPSYFFDGVFIGAGATRAMLLCMVVSTFGVYLPSWYLAAGWGNSGLWLAFALFHIARGASMAAYFVHFSRHRRWLQMLDPKA